MPDYVIYAWALLHCTLAQWKQIALYYRILILPFLPRVFFEVFLRSEVCLLFFC